MNEIEIRLRGAASDIETALPFMDGNILNLLREVKRGLLMGADEIERLTVEVAAFKEQLAAIADVFHIGGEARTLDVIMTNIDNVCRRSDCLSSIEHSFFTELTPSDDEEEPYEECSLNWGATPEEYVEQFRQALREHEARLLEKEAEHLDKITTGKDGKQRYSSDQVNAVYQAMLASRPKEKE